MTRLTSVRWSHVSTCLLLLYWAALALGTHLPGSSVPQTPVSDKSLHFMAFWGLGFLLAWAWRTRCASLLMAALAAVLVVAVYAGIDEMTQAFIPGRFADVADWCYDLAGTVVGVAALVLADAILRTFFRASPQQAR